LENVFNKGCNNNIKNYNNKNKLIKYRREIMIIIDKLVNRLKMRNTKETNPGNVYIPNDFEVEERKKDVDANEK